MLIKGIYWVGLCNRGCVDSDIRDWLPTASAQSGTGCRGTGVEISQTAAGEARMFIWGWEWWSPDVYLGSGSRQPPGRQLALGTGPESV